MINSKWNIDERIEGEGKRRHRELRPRQRSQQTLPTEPVRLHVEQPRRVGEEDAKNVDEDRVGEDGVVVRANRDPVHEVRDGGIDLVPEVVQVLDHLQLVDDGVGAIEQVVELRALRRAVDVPQQRLLRLLAERLEDLTALVLAGPAV